MSNVQSVLFDNKIWDILNSHQWLIRHNLYPIKSPHITKNKIRYRLKHPSRFKQFSTKQLPHGIHLVIGYK